MSWFLIPSDHHCEVWQVRLSQAGSNLTALESILSPTERARAAAFLRPAPRRQFVVARAALRTVLGQCLGMDPTACHFSFNAHGKPSLVMPSLQSSLQFNVSHSGDVVLIAVADGVAVGVDVEAHRHIDDMAALAASILGPEDLVRWHADSAAEGAAAFYRVWTCKEAIAKAIGCGLTMDFKTLRVRLAPGLATVLACPVPAPGGAETWCLRELEVADGYSACLAVAAADVKVTQRHLHLHLQP